MIILSFKKQAFKIKVDKTIDPFIDILRITNRFYIIKYALKQNTGPEISKK